MLTGLEATPTQMLISTSIQQQGVIYGENLRTAKALVLSPPAAGKLPTARVPGAEHKIHRGHPEKLRSVLSAKYRGNSFMYIILNLVRNRWHVPWEMLSTSNSYIKTRGCINLIGEWFFHMFNI